MIDCHCHLEQKEYDDDRNEIIEKCRQQLKAIITSCAHPKDFDLTMRLVERYNGFVFATVGIHPEYIKEISDQCKSDFLKLMEANKDKIVGIGEVGLDYSWVKEQEWRAKQRELFIEFISLAQKLNKPLVIHARNAFADAIEILKDCGAKAVLMHFFTAKELFEKIVENGWYISVNTTLLASKKIKKIVRDAPIEQILTETDSPWLGGGKRNDPTSVRVVIEKIAEIKKLSFEEVDRQTTENAVKFFNLQI